MLQSTSLRGRRLSESLQPHERLRQRSEFQHCYRNGYRLPSGPLSLFVAANDLGHARLGVTTTRKVGKAVSRKRQQRRTREVFRRWPQRGELPAVDMVVHFAPGSGEQDFDVVRRALESGLRRVMRKSAR